MPKGFSPKWTIVVSLTGKQYRHSFKRRHVDLLTVYREIATAINRSVDDISLGNEGSFTTDQGTRRGHWVIMLADFIPFR